jgi:hypothetical protein
MLIDWVNSIDMPSCLLASSTDDLKSGVVLCDLVASLQQSPPFAEVERHNLGDSRADALHNLKIVIEKLHQNLPADLRLTPRQLYEVRTR